MLYRAGKVLACGVLLYSLSASPVTHTPLTRLGAAAPSEEGPYGVWQDGTLLLVKGFSARTPVLQAYDNYGLLVDSATLRLPDVSIVNIYSSRFARTADGWWAVSGSAYNDRNQGVVFLALLSSVSEHAVVIRTRPYVPTAVIFAADGTVWTAGREFGEHGKEEPPDYPLIRRFDQSGRLLGTTLLRSTIGRHTQGAKGSQFIASRDRVGWYSPAANIYIEFRLDGSELGRYPIRVQNVAGIAMCPKEEVWMSYDRSDGQAVLGRLERNSGTVSGDMALGVRQHLYGCDEEGYLGLKVPHAISWWRNITK